MAHDGDAQPGGVPMLTREFPGAAALTDLIRRAVAEPDVAATTATMKQGLTDLITRGELRLPAECGTAVGPSYARRLLYRCPDSGVTVIAMTWGPEQGTPVHDHAGLWCVEAVCTGRIGIENYALLARDGARFQFAPQGVFEAGEGSAGHLIPPLEYHRIFNPRTDSTAVSLHVYGGEMTECGVFEAEAGGLGAGWYRRGVRQLSCVD
jgi:predicted metal-dependent enzyme (double-stranded beta helix superfamily)